MTKEEQVSSDRYVLDKVPSSYGIAVVDTKTEQVFTTEQALTLILNKLDELLKFTNSKD